MKKLSKVSIALGLSLAFAGQEVLSAEYYAAGNMINVSSIAEGFIFQLDRAGPDNCKGATHYFIRAANKVMIAEAMMKWAQKDTWVTVYTTGRGTNGWEWTCELNQFQPW